MAVRPETLETPERGIALETRQEGQGDTRRGPGPTAELRALRERIAAVRAQKHGPMEPEAMAAIRAQCRDCASKGFGAGWAAALEAIERD